MATPSVLLHAWIARGASPEAVAWFEGRRAEVERDPAPRILASAFALVPRRMGRADLALEPSDLADADAARPGWQPADLTKQQAARILLLLDAATVVDSFAQRLKDLVATADLGELIAIYKGLPLYPDPDTLVPLAIDGLRTTMRPVFEAVAHRNPFPAERLPQSAWNHMVLKTLFIESVLYRISGLEGRWNAELAVMLIDYARERWAAHRPVAPTLWRGVGRFADAAAIVDLARVLAEGDVLSQRAAALALAESREPDAAAALALRRDLAGAVEAGDITWNDVSGLAQPA